MTSKMEILGVRIDPVTREDVLARIRDALGRRERLLALYVHVMGLNIAYGAPWLREFLNRADIVYCDGAGVALGARLLGGSLPDRFPLADWMPDLMRTALEAGAGVFLLGAPPGVAEAAGRRLAAEHPGLHIAGAQHGYFDHAPGSPGSLRIVNQINESGAGLLLVGMGFPLQERWLLDNLPELHVPVVMTVGGVFEYWGGTLVRAPRWLRDNGLEWLALTLQAPRRYWKRHVLGNPLFVTRVLRQRFRK